MSFNPPHPTPHTHPTYPLSGLQLAKAGRRGKGAASTKPAKKSEFSKSAAVFAKIQQHADGTTAAAAAAAAASAAPRATHLKL